MLWFGCERLSFVQFDFFKKKCVARDLGNNCTKGVFCFCNFPNFHGQKGEILVNDLLGKSEHLTVFNTQGIRSMPIST